MLRPFRRSRRRLDQPRLRYGPAGLSASTVASQEMGEPSENQVHCGSTEVALVRTVKTPSVAIVKPSDIAEMWVKSRGGPTVTGTYQLLIQSFNLPGTYTLDISAGSN